VKIDKAWKEGGREREEGGREGGGGRKGERERVGGKLENNEIEK
jgi:hypothetical protein